MGTGAKIEKEAKKKRERERGAWEQKARVVRKRGDLSICIFLEIREKEKSLYLGLIFGYVSGGGRLFIWRSPTVLGPLCNNQPTI